MRKVLVTSWFLAGCPIADEEVPTGDTGEGVATLSGTVGRTAPIASDGDGVGTLFVGAFDVCGTGALLGATGVPDADLSAEGAAVPFVLEALPRIPVFLGSFLDDDGNADPAGPLPEVGDLVFGEDAGDGVVDCFEVDLSGGDADGVHFDLNLLEE